jgi:hypothetical protein
MEEGAMPARFPFPLPNGWSRRGATSWRGHGERLFCLGRAGRVPHRLRPRASSTPRPHLGAHLGVGGSARATRRSVLRRLALDADGCVEVPYAERIPRART